MGFELSDRGKKFFISKTGEKPVESDLSNFKRNYKKAEIGFIKKDVAKIFKEKGNIVNENLDDFPLDLIIESDSEKSHLKIFFDLNMELSMSKDVPLINLMTVGKSRTQISEELLKSMLSDNPIEVFTKINNLNKIKAENEGNPKKADIISIGSNAHKKNMLDDIDF